MINGTFYLMDEAAEREESNGQFDPSITVSSFTHPQD